uniref:Uncharacterized protein n=1 Tax=Panagrellus redivivus TaxID=6233 RepID=A0A7E4VLG9_PANRE
MSKNSPHNSLEEKVFDEIVDEKNDKPPPEKKKDSSEKSKKSTESQAKSPDSGGSKKKKSSKKPKSKGKVKNPDDSNSKDSNSSKKKKKSGSGSKGKKKRNRPKGKGKSKSKPKKEPTSEPISDEFEGESLGECSEKEWEGAEAAYNPTLINLKKKQNRVTVFAATKKIDKKKAPGDPDKEPSQVLVAVGSEALPGPVAPLKPDDHADMIGKLVAGVVRKYLEGKADDDVKVEIKLTCGDGTVTPVLP